MFAVTRAPKEPYPESFAFCPFCLNSYLQLRCFFPYTSFLSHRVRLLDVTKRVRVVSGRYWGRWHRQVQCFKFFIAVVDTAVETLRSCNAYARGTD